MPLHTLPQTHSSTGHHPADSPPRTPGPAADPTAAIAAVYPTTPPPPSTCSPGRPSPRSAAADGSRPWGSTGRTPTCETPLVAGTLVLDPMAGLHDLDTACAEEDDADPGVWHVLVRHASGLLVDGPYPTYGCPSVLSAEHAGIDPEAAVGPSRRGPLRPVSADAPAGRAVTAVRPASAGRRPYVLGPAGRDALDELRLATDLVRDARESVAEHAARRGRAVLAARRAGVP